jgi:trehalose synthase
MNVTIFANLRVVSGYSVDMAKIPKNFRTGKLSVSFAEQFFPARPDRLLKSARTVARTPLKIAKRIGPATASNRNYVNWLRRESMLRSANLLASRYVGRGSMWQNPYARPQPRAAIRKASVWYTAYPNSLVTKPGKSIIRTLADEELWQTFSEIGIEALHTGPMKLSGGISGWKFTPSVDGHFDRISNRLDQVFGTEAEFIRMSKMATKYGGIIIDDIIPGHTGKGADFRLAEMKYRDYPGIYHMVEIAPEDQDILPSVPAGHDAVNVNSETEQELKKRGYIIGRLQRVIFFEPGVKETNWSVTKPIRGIDGVTRRWVYLHYFKEGQPSINWLDPSFAGMKLVIGDAVHSIGDLGSTGLRLDANGFLGVEISSDEAPAWSEGHPLSEAANLLIAGMVRKMGGFTFQELNLSFDDIKSMSVSGADLSYDFITRPAYHHALTTGDTEFLRLCMKLASEHGIEPASLVHAMQNHDDLTYELVHFWTLHKNDEFEFRSKKITGEKLREIIRTELNQALTGKDAPYNLAFTTNGIACTTASVIAANLGYKDLSKLSLEDIKKIMQIHLLLVMFNAFQPGVFALSGWDLSGSLPLEPIQVQSLIRDGDTRWINRGSYDLMNCDESATVSAAGIPLANNLYGSLPKQMKDPNSFARRLQDMLKVRKKYGLATAHQVDVPEVSDKGLLVMVHRLDKKNRFQVTVLNFSNKDLDSNITSEALPSGARVNSMFKDLEEIGMVNDSHSFSLTLPAYTGASLLIETPE